MPKPRTHIPNGVRTYCGKFTHLVECINLDTTAIDEATCRTCQRSDDRRQIEQWRRELFEEGCRDYFKGHRTNPYDPEDEEGRLWARGFKHAKTATDKFIQEAVPILKRTSFKDLFNEVLFTNEKPSSK